AVKTHTSDPGKLIETIEGKWAQFVPSDQFRYEFMDESFEMMHTDVAKSGHLFNIFSVLAIIIACLGLFGLSAFKANQRERELGIRKVLGANMRTIIFLISKDYIFLILLANLIAVPLGWYIVSNILGSFAYRVDIGWQTFALAAGLTIGIAIGTISYQSVKAALKNPIDAIKEV
ncbi:MAG: FtsX-like permease family protein, partial [Bacteroidota bacterium]